MKVFFYGERAEILRQGRERRTWRRIKFLTTIKERTNATECKLGKEVLWGGNTGEEKGKDTEK